MNDTITILNDTETHTFSVDDFKSVDVDMYNVTLTINVKNGGYYRCNYIDQADLICALRTLEKAGLISVDMQ